MERTQGLAYRLGIAFLTVALIAFLAGCVNKAQQNFQRPPAPVTVATAVAQDVSSYLDSLGKISQWRAGAGAHAVGDHSSV